MATPLHQLVDAVLFDPAERELFRQAPETYLRSAGYEDLGAADVQEAMFVLADGAHPDRALHLIRGGRAIGDVDDIDDAESDAVGLAGAGEGLGSALDAVPIEVDDLDDLDDLDDVGPSPAPPPTTSGVDDGTDADVTFGADDGTDADVTFGAGAAASTDELDSPTPDTIDDDLPDHTNVSDDTDVLVDDPALIDIGPEPDLDEFAADAPTDTSDDGVSEDWDDLEI